MSDTMSRFEVSDRAGRSFFDDDEPQPEHGYRARDRQPAPEARPVALRERPAPPVELLPDDGDELESQRSRGLRIAWTGALALVVLVILVGATYAGTRFFVPTGDRDPSVTAPIAEPERGEATTLADPNAAVPQSVPSAPAQSPESAATTAAPSPTKPAAATTKAATGVAAAPAKGEREEVLRLVNVERAKAGCSALTDDGKLRQAADAHSADQANAGKISHVGTDGAELGARVDRVGYRWRGIGENVAAGYATPAAVMQGWMNSDGHRANILNCGFKNLGVGLASKGRTLYWTQVFGTPA
jgi:uncharacterized protein YkwD